MIFLSILFARAGLRLIALMRSKVSSLLLDGLEEDALLLDCLREREDSLLFLREREDSLLFLDCL